MIQPLVYVEGGVVSAGVVLAGVVGAGVGAGVGTSIVGSMNILNISLFILE